MTQKKIGAKDHVGEVHGVFTLVEVSDEKDKYGHYIYKGVCNECGYIKYSHYGNFSGKLSKTTVCKHVELGGRHLIYLRWNNNRIGNIFRGMKARCYNENDKSYCNYGAKGIKICNEWLDNPKLFEEWSIANGYNDNLTIDRIDSSKDYCPSNCRWITVEENSKNKPTTNFITVNEQVHTGREWSKILGFSANRINKYILLYGEENVKTFIARRLANPKLEPKHKQSYYDLYMSDNSIGVN